MFIVLLLMGAIFFAPNLAMGQLVVQTSGISNTQALLAYRIEEGEAPCVVEVWEGEQLPGVGQDRPLVHDVNPALFEDAHLDNRSGNASFSGWRVAVIGQRRVSKATNNRLYSRALQTNTPHIARVTCGAQVALVHFTTANLPTGATHPENPPFNADGFGNYGWPTIDWTNHDQTYIDPLTGVLLKRFTSAGEWGSRVNRTFAAGQAIATPAWSTPQNALSGATSSLAATSTADSPLFLAIKPETFPPGHLGGFFPDRGADDIAIRLYGSGNNSTAANRMVSVCLSIDSGQSCYSDSLPVTLPSGSANEVGLFPSSFPSAMYTGWGARPVRQEHWPRMGKVSVAAGTVTLTRNLYNAVVPSSEVDSNSVFDVAWPQGTRIWIQGSPCAVQFCTVDSVLDGYHLKLQEEFALPETDYRSANFGFRITKVSGTGTVSLSARYEYAWSFAFTLPYTGGTDQCSVKKVTTNVTANGTPLTTPRSGYLCVFPFSGLFNGALYFVDTDNGDFRFISAFRTPSAIPNHVSADLPLGAVTNAGLINASFDPDNPAIMYTSLKTNSGRRAIFKLTYGGDYRTLRFNYRGGEGGDTPANIPDGMIWENVTRSSNGRDLQSQIDQRFLAYDKTRFGSFDDSRLAGVVDHFAMFTLNYGNQDSPCWNFVFDLRNGNLLNGFNSLDGLGSPLLRWAGCHSTSVTGPFFGISNNALVQGNTNSNYGGPFTTKVTALLRLSGLDTDDTRIGWPIDTAYNNNCPAGLSPRWIAAGATGNRCLTVRVPGEPCSAAATANEKIWSPCPRDASASMAQPLVEGDLLGDASLRPADGERFRIVRRTDLPSGELEFVLQRNAVKTWCAFREPGNDGIITGPSQMTHVNGWSLMVVPSGETCEGGIIYYDPKTNAFSQESRFLISGHFDLGVSPQDSFHTLLGSGFVVRYNQPRQSLGAREDFYIEKDPVFEGVRSFTSAFTMQSYGSIRQWAAPQAERRWALDFRHINGSTGTRPEAPGQVVGEVRTLSAQPGTRNVYRLPIIGAVHYKKLPLLVFAGYHLLQEFSSASMGDVLTDAQPWRFCYAYRIGECRSGSQAGDLFAVIPGAMLFDRCWTSQTSLNVPCAFSNHAHANWVVQFDISRADAVGAGFRRISMGLSGPSRQYVYANARATPDGKWAILPGFWLDGAKQELLAAKLPPFTATDNRNRASFVDYEIQLTPPPVGSAVTVSFGYREFGEAGDFYCTARQEQCIAGSPSSTTPFRFASEFSAALHARECAAGCTLTVPAVADRVLYYRLQYYDESGTKVGEGTTQAVIP